MSARQTDLNGFVTIKGNPISKVGIFEYSGSQLGLEGDDASRVFNVYRPAEELSDPECLASFQLLPFINDHVMLGSEDDGMTPPERKGVEGYIGEEVYFDPPYLRGTLRIVSESLKSAIGSGKVELSPGYRCVYEMTPGVYNGKQYDAVQRKIRGNHLALVDEGRTGPDVAVLDTMTFTVDSATLKEAFMADEKNPVEAKATDMDDTQKAEIRALLIEVLAELGIKGPAADEKPAVAEKAKDEEIIVPAASAEGEVEKKAEEAQGDADAAIAVVEGLKDRIDELEEVATGMDARIFVAMADRDALADRLSNFVGAFDSKLMTPKQVAEYGVKKLGIPCAKGSERIALDAWLHGRTPERHKVAVAQDSAGFDIMKKWGAQK